MNDLSYESIVAQAVRTAKEKKMTSKEEGPFTGGFDIMERLVKKLRKDQKKKAQAPTQDFSVMKKLIKNPTPVKKNKDSMEPLEYAPDEPIAR